MLPDEGAIGAGVDSGDLSTTTPDTGTSDTGSEGGDNTAQPETPATPETPTLDVLGRKMTAEQLKDEHERLASEFTRRSQRLAELERSQQDNSNKAELENLTPEERRAKEIIAEIENRAVDSAKKVLQPELDKLKAEVATREEIRTLEAKYPDFDHEKVINFALNRPNPIVTSLEDAYKVMMFEQNGQSQADKARKETAYNMSQKPKVAPGSTEGQAPTGLRKYDPEKDKGKSIKDLLKEGFKELGI